VIVVDASVAVKWFVTEEGHTAAAALLDRNEALIALDLIFAETANVLWKKLRKGEATSDQAFRACHALPDFFQRIVATTYLIVEAFELAKRIDHSVYDCVYLACAQQQGAKLVTADKKFVDRVRGAGLGHLAVDLDKASDLTHGPQEALSISDAELARVLILSDRFLRTMTFVEEQVGRATGERSIKWIDTADLVPAFNSPAHLQLKQAIRELSMSNLCDLVALAWLGRGFDGRDWATLRKSAEGLLGNNPMEHDGYIISLLSYVRGGIEALSKIRPPQAQ
jgi:predicted nucleic acid-binding protein